MSDYVKEIEEKDFESLVINGGNVILDFYSTECPPCEAVAPKFHFFADVYGDKIKFYKIFRQGNKELALNLGVKSSPTLLFFKDGKEVHERLNGAIKKKELKDAIIESYNVEDKIGDVKRTENEYDIAIIGGGPAGLTAALYASRAKLKTVVIDKSSPGGFVNVTHSVANYPGTGKEIQGFMLGHYMSEQAKENKAEIIMAADIEKVDLDKKIIDIDDDKRVKAKAIIIATGTIPRPLNIKGEKEFAGKGISYCATCDGSFYEGKKVYVIGGGNSAVEEAIYLTKFVKELTIVHQFDELQANKTSQEEAFSNPKIKFLWSHEPRGFLGESHYEKLEVEDLKTGQTKILDEADGIFVFVGYVPQTALFENRLTRDDWGYIKTDENMSTNIPGIYAVGDIRSKKYRQITTAVSDGTIAALEAEKFIKTIK